MEGKRLAKLVIAAFALSIGIDLAIGIARMHGEKSSAETVSSTVADVDAIRLKVGKPVDYTPGFLPAQVVCDDVSVIRVEDAKTRFRLTGLKSGATDCGFFSVTGRHRLLHITVVD